MDKDSKFTRDEEGYIAVRVVSGTEALPAVDKDYMFARDTNGNIAVRVVGGGGGSDQHNLGYFATQAALEEAYPTATAGDYAIVGSTDTVWIWDTDTSAWVDSDQKGQVTSVNGQTGDVVLDLLPSQTGQSGKFLTTDGTDASWSDKPLVNKATNNTSLSILGADRPTSNQMVAIGVGAGANTNGYSVVIGYQSRSRSSSGIAIGNMASVGLSASHAIQLGVTGPGITENSDANTFKVGNANGNFEMMSADGTIPEARLADTTNATAGQALVLDSQGNAVWSDISSSPTTAPTLVAANWSNNQQTVNVSGVTATNTVIVAPFPTDAQDYASAGVLCIGQGAGTLTFSCTSVPANDLQVNVVII